MEIDKPNPINNLLLFKKRLWISDYSTRMQKWFSGEKLPPIRIDAELHRRCNLNCIHCMRRMHDKDMSKESEKIEISEKRWLEAVKESTELGVKMWNIAGLGEPMYKPEFLMKMLRSIKHYKMFGELTTNGTLWSEKSAEDLVKMGWDSINISIDAPIANIHDKIRRVPGTFQKAKTFVSNINKFRKKHNRDKPCITINMVLNKLNYKDLPQMVKFVSEIGGDAIFVEPMIVHTKLGEQVKLTSKEIKELPKLIKKADEIGYQNNVVTFISCLEGDDEVKEFNKELVEETGNIREHILKKPKTKSSENLLETILNIPCYYPWFYLIINANGSVIHCGECTDLTENIKTKSLKNIWYGKNFEQTREQFKSNNLPNYCNKCRPNVISDMNIVRKSIREYADVEHMQKKVIQLFIDNMYLKEQYYYAKKGIKPPQQKQSIFDKIKLFKF